MQQNDIILSDNEIAMLNTLASITDEAARSVESLIEGKGLTYAQGLSAIGYLCAKGLAESVEVGVETKRVLRKLGQEYEEQGLPEQRLWRHLQEKGALTLQEVNALLPQFEAKFTIGMYLGAFQKAGYIGFAGGTIMPRQHEMPAAIVDLQRYLSHIARDVAARRAEFRLRARPRSASWSRIDRPPCWAIA